MVTHRRFRRLVKQMESNEVQLELVEGGHHYSDFGPQIMNAMDQFLYGAGAHSRRDT